MLEQNKHNYFQDAVFERRSNLALDWLQRSIQVNAGQGSSAYFHYLKGWAKPYPETTGYLIPTLIKYDPLFPNRNLNNYANQCVEWLISIQNKDGTFNGGLGDQAPVVFDMAQILLGLTTYHEAFPSEKISKSIQSCLSPLMNQMTSAGQWEKWTYKEGFHPMYYTRVIWPLLYASQNFKLAKYQEDLKIALDAYYHQCAQKTDFTNWGFEPNKPAFTHTIAYTLRGFYEAGILLNESKYAALVKSYLDYLSTEFERNGKLAGTYSADKQGNYYFECLTGNAQLSILYSAFYKKTKNQAYLDMAIACLLPCLKAQHLWAPTGIKGGIAGSRPIWGPYQVWRIPNWGMKFFLDAYLALKQIIHPINPSV